MFALAIHLLEKYNGTRGIRGLFTFSVGLAIDTILKDPLVKGGQTIFFKNTIQAFTKLKNEA